MKLLHTADLHLSEQAPERWAALCELVKTAKREKVQVLVIAGDLFDQNVDAEMLRSRLRDIFGGGSFMTVIIPGNHDSRAYRSGLFFGKGVQIITDWREPVRLDGVDLWGLPYEPLEGEKLVSRLLEISSLMSREKYNLLLFHGDLLDAYFSSRDLGSEGTRRYMPVKLGYFSMLPLHYVLAGHFHSRYTAWQIPGGGYFVYPGSPVSVTRRETGRRVANLIVTGQTPMEVPLDTFHYEEIRLTLDPFIHRDPLAVIKDKIEDSDSAARVLLTVEGLYDGSLQELSEEQLATSIREMLDKRGAEATEFNFSDVRHVLEDDLFQRFNNILAKKDYSPEQKQKIREMTIRAFRVVKTCS
ncbi:MAG: DNA repair exonuclease [Bacillota bacterium]|nr:DNA repair exonuclease [Bacillota bacterium]